MNKITMLRQRLIALFLIGLVSVIVVIALGNKASTIHDGTQPSPAIQLTTIDDQIITVPGRPRQVTVLYAMGFSCANCVPGAKTLVNLQSEYAPRGVQFIAVETTPKATAADLQPFLLVVGDNHLIWTLDTSGQFTYLYRVQTLDTAIILDEQGHEIYHGQQSASDKAIRAALDKLLG